MSERTRKTVQEDLANAQQSVLLLARVIERLEAKVVAARGKTDPGPVDKYGDCLRRYHMATARVAKFSAELSKIVD